ncbi:Bug family tripartite tricarboxylate transporter substrate binding protein [Halomonas elongata]|uniref:Bug family tripartite tricarboxylate transporter substrate binding protein n=1 Tax=Halomonas elongata TaxID=2746 RepID=UPI0038D37C42
MKKALVAAICVATAIISPAWAQEAYPDQPITIVVGASPGGSTDYLARLIGEAMGKEMDTDIVVENVPGAGATIGMRRVATSDPDGYTLGFGNMGHLAANVAIHENLGFDPTTDFAPIGNVANVPMVLAVSNQGGVDSLQGFLDYMGDNPGAANFGTSGPGSTGWLAPSLLLDVTDLEAQLVAYQGAGPALNDLIAGVMDAQMDQTVTMIPVHNEGQAKAVAVSSDSRIEQMPNVPTFAEAGLPEFDMVVWNALVAPAGTPENVVAKLEAALDAALDTKAVQTAFSKRAIQTPSSNDRGSEALGNRIEREVDRWISVLEDMNSGN